MFLKNNRIGWKYIIPAEIILPILNKHLSNKKDINNFLPMESLPTSFDDISYNFIVSDREQPDIIAGMRSHFPLTLGNCFATKKEKCVIQILDTDFRCTDAQVFMS